MASPLCTWSTSVLMAVAPTNRCMALVDRIWRLASASSMRLRNSPAKAYLCSVSSETHTQQFDSHVMVTRCRSEQLVVTRRKSGSVARATRANRASHHGIAPTALDPASVMTHCIHCMHSITRSVADSPSRATPTGGSSRRSRTAPNLYREYTRTQATRQV